MALPWGEGAFIVWDARQQGKTCWSIGVALTVLSFVVVTVVSLFLGTSSRSADESTGLPPSVLILGIPIACILMITIVLAREPIKVVIVDGVIRSHWVWRACDRGIVERVEIVGNFGPGTGWLLLVSRQDGEERETRILRPVLGEDWVLRSVRGCKIAAAQDGILSDSMERDS